MFSMGYSGVTLQPSTLETGVGESQVLRMPRLYYESLSQKNKTYSHQERTLATKIPGISLMPTLPSAALRCADEGDTRSANA